jgi:hypothetical protein
MQISQKNVVDTVMRLAELKAMLSNTDYQAIKFAEGLIPTEDYDPIKAQRQTWRDEINQLEGQT